MAGARVCLGPCADGFRFRCWTHHVCRQHTYHGVAGPSRRRQTAVLTYLPMPNCRPWLGKNGAEGEPGSAQMMARRSWIIMIITRYCTRFYIFVLVVSARPRPCTLCSFLHSNCFSFISSFFFLKTFFSYLFHSPLALVAAAAAAANRDDWLLRFCSPYKIYTKNYFRLAHWYSIFVAFFMAWFQSLGLLGIISITNIIYWRICISFLFIYIFIDDVWRQTEIIGPACSIVLKIVLIFWTFLEQISFFFLLYCFLWL